MVISEEQIRALDSWVKSLHLEDITYDDVEYEYMIDDVLYYHPAPDFLGEIEYCSGATKLVFIGSDVDFVVKIPITSQRLYDDDDEPYFEDYSQAINPWTGEEQSDYCLRECQLYKMARKLHLEQFFLPIYNFGSYYLQDKAVAWEDMDTKEELYSRFAHLSVDSKQHVRELKDNVAGVGNCELLAFLYEQGYDDEELTRLIKFLTKNDICDMHQGNWGIKQKGNKKMIIIDYGSFND